MEQGARAALASLYGPTSQPDERRAANDWLVALVDKQEAWDLSLVLIVGPDVDNARFFGASMLRTKLSRGANDLTQDQCTGLLGVLLGQFSEAATAAAAASAHAGRTGSALANELRACCTVTTSKLHGGASALVTHFEAFRSLPPLPMLALLAELPYTLYPPPSRGLCLSGTRTRASERAVLAQHSAAKARDAVAVVPSLQKMATTALRDAAAAVSAATAAGAAGAKTASPDTALTAIAVATEALRALKAWYAPPFVPLPSGTSASTPLSPTGAVQCLGTQNAPSSPAGFHVCDRHSASSTGPLLALASLPAFAALCELGSCTYSGALCASGAIRRGMRRLVAASLHVMAAAADAETDAEVESAMAAKEAEDEMAAREQHSHGVTTPQLAVTSAYPHTAEHEYAEQQLLRVVVSAAAKLVTDADSTGQGGCTPDAVIDDARRVRFSQASTSDFYHSGGNDTEGDDDDEAENDPLSDPLLALASLTAALLSRQTVCARLLARDPGTVDSMLRAALALTCHPRLAIAETFLERRPWVAIIEMRVVGASPGGVCAHGPLAQHVFDAVLKRVTYPFTPAVKVSLLLQSSAPGIDGPTDVLCAAWRQWEEEDTGTEDRCDDRVEQVEWLNFRNSFARDIFEACAAADVERTSVPIRDGASEGQWAAVARFFSHIASKLLPLLEPTQASVDECAWREAEALLFALHCAGGVLQSYIARESASERRAMAAPSHDHHEQQQQQATKLQYFAAVDAALAAIFNVLVSLEDGGACAAAAALASGTLVGQPLVLPRNARSHPAVFLAACEAIGSYASWLGLRGGCSALRPSFGASQNAGQTESLLLRVLDVLATLLQLPAGRTPCVQQAAVAIARLSYDRNCRERLSANNAALDALMTLAVGAVPTPEEATAAATARTVLVTPPLRASMMISLPAEGRHRLFESVARVLASVPVVVPDGAAPWQAMVRRLFDPLSTLLNVWVTAAETSLEAAVRAGPTTAAVLDLFAAAVVLLAPCNAPGLPQTARCISGGKLLRGDMCPHGEHVMIMLLRPVWPCWAQGMRNISLVSTTAGRQGSGSNTGGVIGGEPPPPVITSFVRFMTAALRAGPVAGVPLLPDAARALSAAFEGGLATIQDASSPAPTWLMPCLSGVTSLLQTFGPLLSRRVPTGSASTGMTVVDTAAVSAVLAEVLQRTAFKAGTAVLAGVGGATLAEAYLHCANTTFMCAPDLLAGGGDVKPSTVMLLPQAISIAAGCVGGEDQSASIACLACPPGCARQCDVQRVALALLGAVARAARATTGAAQLRAPMVAHAMFRSATSDRDRVQSRELMLRALLYGLADNLLTDSLPRVADVLAPLLHMGGSTADWVLEASCAIITTPSFPSLQPISPAVAHAFGRSLVANPDPFARAGSTDASAIEKVRNTCLQFAAVCRSSSACAGDASELVKLFIDETFGDGST